MYPAILHRIRNFSPENISDERKKILQPLINYIQLKKDKDNVIRLNFICTHNSRRSHFAQIWAQAMAFNFGIKNIFCYSGGTEATAVYPQVIETLMNQGFQIRELFKTENSFYTIKYDYDEVAIITFSKCYDNDFNPQKNFAAVMTCSDADKGCPVVLGADARIPVKYNDPKEFDDTDLQTEKYAERSLEIGQEMWYVFKSIK